MRVGTRVTIHDSRSYFHERHGVLIAPSRVNGEDGWLVHLDGDSLASMRFATNSLRVVPAPEPHVVAGE